MHVIGPLSYHGCIKAETRWEKGGDTSGRTVFSGIANIQLVLGSSGSRPEYTQCNAAQTAENRARPGRGPRTGWPEAHCRIQRAQALTGNWAGSQLSIAPLSSPKIPHTQREI